MRPPEVLRNLGPAILVSLLLLPTTAGAAETLHVPLATCGGVQTTGSYSGHVRLTVSGWGTYSPGVDAMDAFYKLSIGDDTTSTGACAPCFRFARASEGGCTCGSECSESEAVSSHLLEASPSFNPSHEYSVTLDLGEAAADRLSFGISDCGCFDNTGELVVTVEPAIPPVLCGDGIVEGSEQCDDGNTANGDCCTSDCRFEANAATCPDDGNACTTDLCDGAGACIHAPGNSGSICREAAEGPGCALGSVPAGTLEFPVAISSAWFTNRDSPCGPGSDIALYPTGTTFGCAGWHTFREWPSNASRLGAILQGVQSATFTSPATEAADTNFFFVGGTVASRFSDMKSLFDAKKGPDNTWTTPLAVYDSGSCANPNGVIRIVGFAMARIYSVAMSPSKEIRATVECSVTATGGAGGPDFGTRVSPCMDCDTPEHCDGLSADCPADAREPVGTPCQDDGRTCSTDLCDDGGTCAHVAGHAGTECRASTGACDPAEVCTGSSTACPTSTLAPATEVCRGSTGPCDPAENCTGSSATCPTDVLTPASVECRPSAGSCDLAETCSGSDPGCPDDVSLAGGTPCRSSAGLCDLPEACTGASPLCPVDAFVATGTHCRPAAGNCDQPETCSGNEPACPQDAKFASTTICRAPTGTCDAADYCDGSTDTCPADAGEPPCGISDLCCPGTCGPGEDPDCCNNSITFSDCRIKPSIAVGKPDKYRVSCSVLDASASTNGLHLDTDPLWLVIRDATTSPAACLEEWLSPGACIGDTCDTGTFLLDSCSEDRDCRPCRQTGNGFLCRGNPQTPGISKVALKLLRDGSGRRYKLVMTGSTTDIQCSFASLPWSLGIVQGDDCGDVACTQIDGSRISCPGVP